jgi:hypothetical protein
MFRADRLLRRKVADYEESAEAVLPRLGEAHDRMGAW